MQPHCRPPSGLGKSRREGFERLRYSLIGQRIPIAMPAALRDHASKLGVPVPAKRIIHGEAYDKVVDRSWEEKYPRHNK